jgi:hypothetical protein
MTARLDVLERGRVDHTYLLQDRIAALGLDIGGWTRFEPTILDDLRRVCSTCPAPRRCADDLVAHCDDPAWRDWRDYCPNAAKLNMLVALQLY